MQNWRQIYNSMILSVKSEYLSKTADNMRCQELKNEEPDMIIVFTSRSMMLSANSTNDTNGHQ